jgi:hypothetical protein
MSPDSRVSEMQNYYNEMERFFEWIQQNVLLSFFAERDRYGTPGKSY